MSRVLSLLFLGLFLLAPVPARYVKCKLNSHHLCGDHGKSAHGTLRYLQRATSKSCSGEGKQETFFCKKVVLASMISDFLDRDTIPLGSFVSLVQDDQQQVTTGRGRGTMSYPLPEFLKNHGDTIDQLVFRRIQEFLGTHVLKVQVPRVVNASVGLALPQMARTMIDPGFHLRVKVPFFKDEFKLALSSGPSFVAGISIGLVFLAMKGMMTPILFGLKSMMFGNWFGGSGGGGPLKSLFDLMSPGVGDYEDPLAGYGDLLHGGGLGAGLDAYDDHAGWPLSAAATHHNPQAHSPFHNNLAAVAAAAAAAQQQAAKNRRPQIPNYAHPYPDYHETSGTNINEQAIDSGFFGIANPNVRNHPPRSPDDLANLAKFMEKVRGGGPGGVVGGVQGPTSLTLPLLTANAKPQHQQPQQEEGFKLIPPSMLHIDSFDPFYSPLLSRIDSIFSHLGFKEEGCRERAVCSIYKFPVKYAPYSNLLSAQLSRHPNELKRPVSNSPQVLRYFKYMKAAKDGQGGKECLSLYPACPTDTEQLTNLPMVNTYNQLSELIGNGRDGRRNGRDNGPSSVVLPASSGTFAHRSNNGTQKTPPVVVESTTIHDQ